MTHQNDKTNNTQTEIVYIRNNNKLNLTCLKFPHDEKKIFDGVDSAGVKQIKQEINISDLDITMLVDILGNIPEFPSCKDKYKRSLACNQCGTSQNNTDVVCCSVCLLCRRCQEYVKTEMYGKTLMHFMS